MANRLAVLSLCALMVLSTSFVTDVDAGCSLNDLLPCLDAVTQGDVPSASCCSLVATVDVICFCNLVASSNYSPAYVNNAVQVPGKCGGKAHENFAGHNCAGHVIN